MSLIGKSLKAIVPALDGIFICPNFVLNNSDGYNVYRNQNMRETILEISKEILFEIKHIK
jgi:hypothetical protein